MQASSTPLAQKPLTDLKGVGQALAQTLAKLHLFTVQDLLFHLPMRYLDRTRITAIGALTPNSSVVLQGTVASSRVDLGKRRSLAVTLRDDTGQVTLRFYHFNASQKAAFVEGANVRCFGDTSLGKSGIELYHPEYQLFSAGAPLPAPDDTLTPVYPLTEGISQQRLRKIMTLATAHLQQEPVKELLPADINRHFGLESLNQALQYLHHPPRNAPADQLVEGTHPYQQRLAFEELLAHHLTLRQSRAQARAEQAPELPLPPALLEQLLSALPFAPTAAQQRVMNEIFQDLRHSHPMLRLVQGDVGSGKTLVAAAAALASLGNGHQVALAAPTEILAEQHRNSFERWLEPLGFSVEWLVGRLTPTARKRALARIAAGEAQLVVGTHALFQEDVAFARLGLVIIDEQHRFGVHQRLSLRDKGGISRPHQLVMTATPIPRTLAMTAYADLDVSVIDELPPGRTPVSTVLVSQDRKEEVMARVFNACNEGRQAYWVCTLVEGSETLSASAAEETVTELAEALPALNIGLVHGRLKAREKEAAMTAFKQGHTQLLVATTVIEVGVDVPNASLMIIENPERLGLAQLHQLRGRVGRGQAASFCVLLYGNPLSQIARRRLQVLRDSNDGFAIAEHDMSIRGPGELLGTRQTGEMNFRLADLGRDAGLLDEVERYARPIETHNPEMARALIQRWFPVQADYLKG